MAMLAITRGYSFGGTQPGWFARLIFPGNGLHLPVAFLCQFMPKTGWWYTYPSEIYKFVSWDGYSQLNGK